MTPTQEIMKRPSKTQQAVIDKIDLLSSFAINSYRHSLFSSSVSDYKRGEFCGYQLSISLLIWDMPKFASDVITDRPQQRRAA